MTYTINSLLKARNLLPCKIARGEKITLIFLTVLGNMKISLKFGASDFMFSQFDAELRNRGIKYLHKIGNLHSYPRLLSISRVALEHLCNT